MKQIEKAEKFFDQLKNPNTIILNASGGAVNTLTSSAFYVKPIRGPTSGTLFRNLLYNANTSEISYGSVSWGNITTNPTKAFIIDNPDKYDLQLLESNICGYKKYFEFENNEIDSNINITLISLFH